MKEPTRPWICSKCKRSYRIPIDIQPSKVKCPGCNTITTIPAHEHEVADRKAEPLSNAPPEYTYAAFISYRHSGNDSWWARWLHRKLEAYRPPRKMRAILNPDTIIRRVFLDDAELSAATDLSREIRNRLYHSRFLIVVCSPNTPESEWVEKEIHFFRELGRGERILSVLIDGEPEESFPEPLRDIRPGQKSKKGEKHEKNEPLAADVRPQTDLSDRSVRHKAILKLMAPLLGCNLDDLIRRDEERRRRNRASMIAAACLMLALVLAASGVTYYQYRQTNLAKRKLQDTEKDIADVNRKRAEVDRFDERQREKERLEKHKSAPEFVDVVPVWSPADAQRKQAFAAIRQAALQDLKVLKVEEVFSQFAGRTAKFGPPKLGLPQKGGNETFPLPEKFVLEGKLGAVRVSSGETWVYLWSAQPKGAFSGFGPIPDCLAVIYPGEDMAVWLADYQLNDTVRAVVSRDNWKQFHVPNEQQRKDMQNQPGSLTSPKLLDHLAEFRGFVQKQSGMPIGYWCVKGHGIEKVGQARTWIDPKFGREELASNEPALRSSLGMMLRHPESLSDATGVITAQYRGWPTVGVNSRNRVLILFVPQTQEGPLIVLADFGQSVTTQELTGYKMNSSVNVRLTLVRNDIDPTGLNFELNKAVPRPLTQNRLVDTIFSPGGPGSQNSLTTLLGRHVIDPKLASQIDPLTATQFLFATCDWIQLANEPSTVVLKDGPRRPIISQSEQNSTNNPTGATQKN